MPAGTQPHEVFKLRGKGIQRIGSTGKGDLFVRVIVDIPKNVSAEQKELLKQFDKTYTGPGKGGKEGCLGNFGVGFHDFYLLQMMSDGWQEKQKTFRRSCRLAEETKGRKPSAVPLFFVPCIGNTLNGIPSYPCYCNGSSRLHLLPIRRSRCTASSAA